MYRFLSSRNAKRTWIYCIEIDRKNNLTPLPPFNVILFVAFLAFISFFPATLSMLKHVHSLRAYYIFTKPHKK